MIVAELKRQLEKFDRELIQYRDLWNASLGESGLPDYAVENIHELKTRGSSLLRQLGRLRPYMEDLHSSWVFHHRATRTQWNILDAALGLQTIAVVKGPSLNALVDAVQIVLGRLDDYPAEDEFRIGTLVTTNFEIELAERVCARVGKAARSLTSRRATKRSFELSDEYDVQDLLHALLRAFFKYPVTENPVSKSAGPVSTRADLCIQELGLIVEVKFVRTQRDQKRIEKELAEDLVFYTAWDPLKYLFFVIFNSPDLQNADCWIDFPNGRLSMIGALPLVLSMFNDDRVLAF
jgi:hypothetical protein